MIVAQISDPHISQTNPENDNALERAVRHLINLPAQPDIVFLTGDCTDNGTITEYQRCQELLHPLTMPTYVIPGNHDNRIHLQQVFGPQGTDALSGFVQYVVDQEPIRLIALDTNIPDQAEGRLCAERLTWLEERLAQAPQSPTILFMHHPPFRTGLTIFDQIGLIDAHEFGLVVARHPQIERIVAGHAHWAMQRRFHGTVAMTCPATTSLLLPDFQRLDQLAVVMQPPACLLHVWLEAAGVVTYTSLIGDHPAPQLIHDGKQWLP
jgi:3',5'-cyclic-AMP phosphodiesterase